MSTSETEEGESPRPRRAAWWTAAVLLFAAIAFAHLFRLTGVPRGLYFDECSVGLNAARVAVDGRDEHEVFLPVFFVSFGNLKNPLLIYATALAFRLAGASDWLLRATPVAFFLAFLAGLGVLARRLFPLSRSTALYALAAAGFLPWFFTLSRFATEDSSQLAPVVWALVLAHRVYERPSRRPLLAALGLGLLTGLSIYSYTTARLYAFLFVLSLLAVYPARRYLTRHGAMLAGFAVGLIPYVAFAVTHPGELTRRFERVSYLHDPSLGLAEKAGRFLSYYAASFTPTFLLLSGDPNRRHSTGFTGEVYLTVLLLALAGLAVWLRRALPRRRPDEATPEPPDAGDRGRRGDRWVRLLLLGAAASPLGMALTEPQHALRGLELGLYLLLASCYGFALLAEAARRQDGPENGREDGRRRGRLALAALAILWLGLAAESGHMLTTYFGPYAAVSEDAYLSYDFEGLVETALAGGAKEVVVVNRPRVFYALPAFYRETRRSGPPIPLHIGPPVAEPGTCLIYFSETQPIHGLELFPSQLLGSGHQTLMRCFALPPLRDPE